MNSLEAMVVWALRECAAVKRQRAEGGHLERPKPEREYDSSELLAQASLIERGKVHVAEVTW